MKQFIVIAGLAMIVSGCASTSTPVAVDTFCLTSKKRSWSVHDTAETIRDAEVHNKAIDLRCGVPGKKA